MGQQITFIDFETSGLDVEKHHLIECAAVRVDLETQLVVKEFDSLISLPKGQVLSQDIIKLTRITNDMVQRGGAAPFVLSHMLSVIGDTDIIAYNSFFDFGFLRRYANDLGLKILSRHVYDAMELTYIIMSSHSTHKQSDLVRECGIQTSNAHRAMNDVRALIDAFWIVCQKLKLRPPDVLKILTPLNANTAYIGRIDRGNVWFSST